MECLVLSANTYDFENQQGNRISGTKISYIDKSLINKENQFGIFPLMMSTDRVISDELLKQLPALCNLSFNKVLGKNNKPEDTLSDIKIVLPIDVNEMF